jgi:hypothetical protein
MSDIREELKNMDAASLAIALQAMKSCNGIPPIAVTMCLRAALELCSRTPDKMRPRMLKLFEQTYSKATELLHASGEEVRGSEDIRPDGDSSQS